MADSSPPSTPTSFKSTFSSLPASDSCPTGHQDVKLTTAVVHPSRKMSDDSSSPAHSVKQKDKGKNTQVYAPEEDIGAGSGAGEGGEEEGLREGLMSVVIATVRDVELRYRGQAVLAGMPLIGILEREAGMQVSLELPEVAVAMPEDIDDGEELEQEGAEEQEQEEERASLPSPAPPAQVHDHIATKEELLDERQPEYDLGDFFPEEFDVELERVKEPAFQYGILEREEELAEAEQRRKEEVRAKLRIERQRIHDKVWEEYVALGKKYVDDQCKAGNYRPTPRPNNVPRPPVDNPEGALPEANVPEGSNPQPSAAPAEGKAKLSPAVTKYLKKYGGKLLKMGFKFGLDIAEAEAETALGIS